MLSAALGGIQAGFYLAVGRIAGRDRLQTADSQLLVKCVCNQLAVVGVPALRAAQDLALQTHRAQNRLQWPVWTPQAKPKPAGSTSRQVAS
jgi:hypothetical protein